jgi:hypothetical protein
MSRINLSQELQLLEENPVDYPKLLTTLCQLEKRYLEIKTLIKVGFSEDIKDTWEIIKVADLFNKKIITRFEEVSFINNDKTEKDLWKIIEINNAINAKIMAIIEERVRIANLTKG